MNLQKKSKKKMGWVLWHAAFKQPHLEGASRGSYQHHKEFESSLGYVRLCLKIKRDET